MSFFNNEGQHFIKFYAIWNKISESRFKKLNTNKYSIMKDRIGAVLMVGGVLGVVYYGYQYYEESESFEALGADVAISTGDYTPIIISVVVMIAGIAISKLNFK